MQIKITILPDLGKARSVEFENARDARDFFDRMLPQEPEPETPAASEQEDEPVIPKRRGFLGIFSRR